ncbi:MAG: TatD family hydrolase [Christensenellales bacterium]|jgi:TatD DNase family protein
MKLFDTHTHLSLHQFSEDRSEVIARMRDAGVERALVVVDATEDVPFATSLVEAHDFLFLAGGVHPHNASKYTDESEAITRALSLHPKFVALGEIGLDYHYDFSPREVQREIFTRQLLLAHELGKPVQLHVREAHGDTIEILRDLAAQGKLPAGIMHCYTGSWESAKVYLSLGLYISLAGTVTFKNAPKLAEVAAHVPLDRLLVETDCPFMAPVPLRGKRNEPAFIVHTVARIAAICEVDAAHVARATYENACRVFGVGAG